MVMTIEATAVNTDLSINQFAVGEDMSATGSLDEIMASVYNEGMAKEKKLDAALKGNLADPVEGLKAKAALKERDETVLFINSAKTAIKTTFEKLVLSPS